MFGNLGSKAPSSLTDEIELWSRSPWANVDVVGESYHERELRSLFPRTIADSGVELKLPAHLVPEPRNPHDRNAVAVQIEGRTIGYLAAAMAPAYQPMLLQLAQQGEVAVTQARLWAIENPSWDNPRKKEFRCTATIVLDEPWMSLPANGFPTATYAMLPHGSALQARKEDECMSAITPLLNSHGECFAVATLHRLEPEGKGKPLVELRLDGQRVGELTPAMSEHFFPVIDALRAAGRLTAARVIVKGNPLKADVVLYASKAHELPAEWLAAHVPNRLQPQPPQAGEPVTVTPPSAAMAVLSAPVPAPMPPAPVVWHGVEHDLRHPAQRSYRFNPPAQWPQPPVGWSPPVGWRPDPSWAPVPAGWQFWSPLD